MAPLAILLALSLSQLPGVGRPFEARAVALTETERTTSVRGDLAADLDGDGIEEYARGVRTGLLVRTYKDGLSKTITQLNLPPKFVGTAGRALLDAAADVNGDGRKELLLTAWTEAGWEQRLLAVDVFGDGVLLDVALGTGVDAREDGRWDGNHAVLAIQRDGQGGQRAVIVRNVQYDRLHRALLAVDLATGKEAWSLPTAGNIGAAVALDLDGDGRDEVIAGMGSAGNLRAGEEVRGQLDDRARVLGLSADGEILWERDVAAEFAGPFLSVADLDGDGRAEIVVAPSCTSSAGSNDLRVLDAATGRDLAVYPARELCRGVHAWRDEASGEGRVLVTLDGLGIVVLRYVPAQGLEPLVVRPLPTNVHTVKMGRQPGVAGPVFLAVCAGGAVYLFDDALRELADLEPSLPVSNYPCIWDAGDVTIYSYQNRLNSGFVLDPVPPIRRYAGLAGYGLGLALLAGGGTAAGRHRRRLTALRHTSRLDLLRAFLTARHGTVGPVGTMERALWAAENAGSVPAERVAEAWAACADEARPDLEALLEKAEHVRLDPPLLRIVRREYGNFVRQMDRLTGLAPDARGRSDAVQAARTSFGLMADGLRSMGAALAASCRADAAPLAAEVVARHAQRRPAIRFTAEAPAGEDLPVHADRLDLEFAVDNLLDNAARVLAGREGAAVTITLAEAGRQVVITVDDNGPGVAPADRERIFAAGESSRAGGGVGLWHARAALRYYGGDLTVDDAPGGGARFVIRLLASLS